MRILLVLVLATDRMTLAEGAVLVRASRWPRDSIAADLMVKDELEGMVGVEEVVVEGCISDTEHIWFLASTSDLGKVSRFIAEISVCALLGCNI